MEWNGNVVRFLARTVRDNSSTPHSLTGYRRGERVETRKVQSMCTICNAGCLVDGCQRLPFSWAAL